MAGALDSKTREPVFDREVRGEISYGNYNQVRGYVALNAAIDYDVAVRVSYLRSQRDGLIYNTKYCEHWDNLDNNAAKFDLL